MPTAPGSEDGQGAVLGRGCRGPQVSQGSLDPEPSFPLPPSFSGLIGVSGGAEGKPWEPQISGRARDASPVQISRGNRHLLPEPPLLSDPLAPLGTVVGFRGGMESLGGKKVTGNGPREANLEASTAGESLLWPSQDALLLSGALALPSSPPPRPVRSKQGGSWGTPWQGPLACGERSGGLAGSESASHDHPSKQGGSPPHCHLAR